MPTIKTLVFSGGGIEAIKICGVIKYLHQNNLLNNIKHLIGTSSGALVSFCLLIGYSYQDMLSFCLSFNWDKIINEPDLDLFIEKFGFSKSCTREFVFKKIMENKGISSNITFLELYNLKKVKLSVTGSCISNNKLHIFNHEQTPNMKLITALLITTNVPFVWAPITYDNKLWIDGGLLLNYPINISKDQKHTLGINFIVKDKINEINNIFDYLFNIIYTLYKGHAVKNSFNTITIMKEKDKNILEFTKDIYPQMFLDGYNSIERQHFKILSFIKDSNIINCETFEFLD